jgi:hypothetical protein
MNINITDTTIAIEGTKEEWADFIPRLLTAYRNGDFVYAEFLELFRSQKEGKVGRSNKKPNLDFYDRQTEKKFG